MENTGNILCSEPSRCLRYSPAYQLQWKRLGVIWSVGRQAAMNQTRGRARAKPPAVCSARDFHPHSSAGRNTCSILFHASPAVFATFSGAGTAGLGCWHPQFQQRRSKQTLGRWVLNYPSCLLRKCQALKLGFNTIFFLVPRVLATPKRLLHSRAEFGSPA